MGDPSFWPRRGGAQGCAWSVLWLPVLAALILTPLVIRESMRSGRLTCPPLYDDVSYMLDATTRLNTIAEKGLPGFWTELVAWPPHAPFSSLLAAGAIGLFGHVDWGPYAMNALVAALWLGLVSYLFRSRPLWERASLLLLIGLMPMTHMAVREFRPDMLAATLVGWCVVLALEGPLLTMRPRRWALIGVVLGLALIAKPSTTPSTLAVVGLCCAVTTLVELRRPVLHWLRRSLAAGAMILGAAVLVAAPYFAIAGEDIYLYIHDNIFGYRKDMWVVPGTREFHLRYYVDGKGAAFQLGTFAYPLLALVALGAIAAPLLAERGARRRTLALTAAMLAAYAIASWNVMKQPFLGLQFQVLLTITALLSLRLLIEKGPRIRASIPIAAAVIPLLALGAVLSFRSPNPWEPRGHPRFTIASEMHREIDAVIRERVGGGPAMVFVTFSAIVNETNLELAAARRGDKIHFVSREVSRTMEEYEPFLGRAHIVVAAQSGTGLTNDQFPCHVLYDDTVALLDADRNYIRVYERGGLNPNRKIVVFARPRPGEHKGPIRRGPTRGPAKSGANSPSKVDDGGA